MWHVLHFVQAVIVASKDPQTNKQPTAQKMMHKTKTITQKLEIIRRLKHGENQRKVMASYTIRSSTIIYRNRRTNYKCLWHKATV